MLVALRPRHIDFLCGAITTEETIVEAPENDATAGQHMIVKPYAKNDQTRTRLQDLLDTLAAVSDCVHPAYISAPAPRVSTTT